VPLPNAPGDVPASLPWRNGNGEPAPGSP
jgi:hypothetical protein